jgi:hypothetical protein
MKEKWKEYFKGKNAGVIFGITLAVLILCLFVLSRFILFAEARQGVVLDDPVFHWFNAVDLNILIFALIYGSLIGGIVYLVRSNPRGLVVALQTYSLMIIVRMAMMYVFPLDPPMGTIDLQDPLVFIIGTGTKITKDLFFSGHTATLFMIFLVTEKKWLKKVFFINTLLVAVFVVLQKVHYTADVMVAPFVSYGAFKVVSFLNRENFSPQSTQSALRKD